MYFIVLNLHFSIQRHLEAVWYEGDLTTDHHAEPEWRSVFVAMMGLNGSRCEASLKLDGGR